MDFVIIVINIDLISIRCYCAIRLKNERVLLPIFNLEYFLKCLSGNTFFKIGYQVNTKGNTKKETRKFNLPSLWINILKEFLRQLISCLPSL
jgi:hypothetical protein